MDIESDESERWEDFFGSSTDLTPSLIGLYDSLSGNINDNNQQQKIDEKLSDKNIDEIKIVNEKNNTNQNSKINLNHKNHHNHHRNFHILSPNVQRLISHSSTTTIVEKIDTNLLLENNNNNNNSNNLNNLKVHNNKRLQNNKREQKFSHIPLSKNTCKLTQAGNEHVDTFDTNILSSNESLNNYTINNNNNHHQLSNDNLLQIDNDKTPTNFNNNNFCFDLNNTNTNNNNNKNLCQNQIDTEFQQNQLNNSTTTEGLHEEKLVQQENHQQITRISDIVKKFQQNTIIENIIDNQNQLNNIKKTKMLNSVEVKKCQNECFEKNIDEKLMKIETFNQYVKLPKTDIKTKLNNNNNNNNNKPSQPLLTYSRVKILGNNSTTNIGGSSGNNSPKISRKFSAENLDRLTEMKTIQQMNGNSNNNNNNNNTNNTNNSTTRTLTIPELSKLKHRPLSSSSICSTSSSSSSGSENHHKLLGISYLASVESLADQSENELTGSNCNLTVFERACMEIVDSERSFVEDLGQVIKGYLEDWKERACLKLDDLKMLFSNIQEIYDFNSILLKQLVNSGMDPVKIAKCFIDLKDYFSVYTIYCTSYPEAISLLTTLLQASHTNALLTSTQKLLHHTLPLGSYLLKPVQRILKYHLLLDNLRKHCDIEEVMQAYEIMREVARNIDQVKKKLEQQSRVKELSGILDGWLGPELTVLGELKQEGLLTENNKARMVFLFQMMLIITKPKEDNRLQFKSYIYRSNLMLREHLPGEPNSFNVIPYDEPRNQIKLTARNRDQKRLWAQHIKSVILEQFDIPNRAKELVYKLGDEEDRTPDKNIWKWGLNTSTPVYLERRNQYRRSEMRNRSKQKRKTLTNSTSLDEFNQQQKFDDKNLILLRKQSMDDNMIISLPKKQEQIIKYRPKKCHHKDTNCNCNELEEILLRNTMKERSKSVPRISTLQQNCESDDDYHLSTENLITKKQHEQQSVETINNHSLYKFSTLGRTKSTSTTNNNVEIKMYNTKTIPKRIANLKKTRSKKETSKFYMDLNDSTDSPIISTILKITESNDNLNDETNHQKTTTNMNTDLNDSNSNSCIGENNHIDENDVNDDDKMKKDVEIISELLKEHKEFDRILKKPPKKRSFDDNNTSTHDLSTTIINDSNSCSNIDINKQLQPPPTPPSNSPPPLDIDELNQQQQLHQLSDSEPIYETLLRNVHVPYKFSPILNRSKSQQYYTTKTNDNNKSSTTKRPESDYVTLIYSESGDLKSIDNIKMNSTIHNNNIKPGEILHNSDSNINYNNNNNNNCSNSTENNLMIQKSSSEPTTPAISTFQSVGDLQQQHNHQNQQHQHQSSSGNDQLKKNLLQKFILINSPTTQTTKFDNISSISETALFTRGRFNNKLPERRCSDVTEMCRQSIIHRQGSEAVGERMANLDYVDPKTLLFITTNCSRNNSEISLTPAALQQRDSVFSLTSSNDSVCYDKKPATTIDGEKSSTTTIITNDFQYEDNVEQCLENDFRDSAVYSDDNNERRHENHHFNDDDDDDEDYIDSPPPLPKKHPLSLRKQCPLPTNNGAIISPTSSPIPPPIPIKPNNIPLKRLSSTIISNGNSKSSSDITTIINGNKDSEKFAGDGSGHGKSWVLQQIENFNK